MDESVFVVERSSSSIVKYWHEDRFVLNATPLFESAGYYKACHINSRLRDFVAAESQNLTVPDVNVMLEVLTQRKPLLEAESCAAQNRLLLEFLKHLLQQKKEQQEQIVKDISMIESDIEEVIEKLEGVHKRCPTSEDVERRVSGASEMLDQL
ncbi:hypothetical protein WA026_005864 [Henosepilachna vigintioctopunctata]|uniref:Uncharacterized protein n=1 Tax=Henosepilachna vigintioctopunctata TaxID=420089 RepID=A0AAW1U331_9CUCU